MPSVQDILRPVAVTARMAEVVGPIPYWQRFFGAGPNGAASVKSLTRDTSSDIVNFDRTVGTVRGPGDDAHTIAPRVVANRKVSALRHFEKIPLTMDLLNSLRELGAPDGPNAQAVMSYVDTQMQYLVERRTYFREWLLGAMMRTGAGWVYNEEELVPVWSSGTETVSWQVSANHFNQLNGIIGVSWNTPSTDILGDLAAIQIQAITDSGWPIAHAFCNSVRFDYLTDNDDIQTKGGAMAVPWESYVVNDATGGLAGTVGREITSRLKADPRIQWHIWDNIIRLNGSNVSYFGDDEVGFLPEPSPMNFQAFEARETILLDNGEMTDVFGAAGWGRTDMPGDTPKKMLYSLDNFFPRVNPNIIWLADVTP